MDSIEALKTIPNDQSLDTCARGLAADISAQIQNFRDYVSRNSKDIFWATDTAGNLSYMSASIGFYGHRPEAMLGKPLTSFHMPDSAAIIDAHFRQLRLAANTGGLDSFERSPFQLECIDSQGQGFYCEVRARMLRDSAGRFAGLVGIAREIGDKVRMRAELETLVQERTHDLELSEARYRLLAENIKDVILTFDLTLNCTFVTPSVITTGYTPEEFEKLMLAQILTPASYARMCERYVSSMNSVTNPEFLLTRENLELEVLCKDGRTLWAEFRTSFLRDEAGVARGILAVGRNVTDRKQAETEKAGMLAELMQAQKMESVGRLAGGVAHDFNNMLTAMMGYTDLLGAKAANSAPELLKEIDKLKGICERAAGLTKQLLAFSRRQMLNKRALDINQSIAAVDKMLGCLAGANITITTELAINLWPVNADPVNIEQVLMNLIINAIDAMPMGGRVTIKTANRTLKSKAPQGQPEPGQFVVLSITDTGSGMDAATQEAIFEPFFTTKPQGQGTGLGLATAYGIVKQHEGWIEVESELGRGSTFRIYLPASQERIAAETARPLFNKIEPTSENRHILVVEDEPQVRELTVRCLKLYGYQVSEAADGQTALELARQQDYDLVFSDVIMPGMTGLHLAEKLREQRPGCRIMLTSGHMDDKSQWPLIEQMGLPFLAKPFSVSSLIDSIGQALKPEQSC